jgi:hypothetical protein
MKTFKSILLAALVLSPSLAFATAADCEKDLMGAGCPPLLANRICAVSPASSSITLSDSLAVGTTLTVTGASTLTGAQTLTGATALNGGATVANAKTLKLDVGTIAAAGTTQGDATAVVDQISYVTASDDAKGIILPASTVGTAYDIFNTVASKKLLVYPNSGGAINGGSANAAVVMYGKQGLRCSYSASNTYQCGVMGTPTTKTLFVPAGNGRAGATAGWVNTGTDINQATVAASQSASTFTIPIQGLQLGDTIESFKVIGQIESAGNTATLDADLRMLTNAAADPADASLGAITQVSKTADYKVADTKTLTTAELIDSGDMPYVLLTATTAGSTDIRLLGVEVVVRREN